MLSLSFIINIIISHLSESHATQTLKGNGEYLRSVEILSWIGFDKISRSLRNIQAGFMHQETSNKIEKLFPPKSRIRYLYELTNI